MCPAHQFIAFSEHEKALFCPNCFLLHPEIETQVEEPKSLAAHQVDECLKYRVVGLLEGGVALQFLSRLKEQILIQVTTTGKCSMEESSGTKQ